MARPDYLATMRGAVSTFCTEIVNFIQTQGAEPAPASQAETEQAVFPRPESVVTARSFATSLVESGGEHTMAFVKTITEPVEPIACGTCVRSMLEPCSLAAWLLDPSIDARTRVGRAFALRYEGMKQQLKYV